MEELSFAAQLRATAEAALPDIELRERRVLDLFIARQVELCIDAIKEAAANGKFKILYETGGDSPARVEAEWLITYYPTPTTLSYFSRKAIERRFHEELIAKGLNIVDVSSNNSWCAFFIRCEW